MTPQTYLQHKVRHMRSLKYYLTGAVGLQADDVLLSSSPRSGSIWLRFLFCNLIGLQEWNGCLVDFQILNQTMVELGGKQFAEGLVTFDDTPDCENSPNLFVVYGWISVHWVNQRP